MKLRALLCVLLAISACTARPERELARIFNTGRQALQRGNFAEAASAAEQGVAASRDPVLLRWAWTFRLFQAEVHLLRQQGREARPLLAEAPPTGDQFASL